MTNNPVSFDNLQDGRTNGVYELRIRILPVGNYAKHANPSPIQVTDNPGNAAS